MRRTYHSWSSLVLKREMEMIVFGDRGTRVLVFPTRVGRFFDYENWRIAASISEKIREGYLQLFCLDSIDAESLYCDWMNPADRMRRHLDYERYVIEEVLPFSESLNPSPWVIAHGCSLGAYHAMNIGLKYPDLFHKIVSFSGRYDLTQNVGGYRDLFDGYYDESVYYNIPNHYVANMHDETQLAKNRKQEIIFTIGREDALLDNNRDLSQKLWEKGIWHRFDIWEEEAHRARYWRKMAPIYL